MAILYIACPNPFPQKLLRKTCVLRGKQNANVLDGGLLADQISRDDSRAEGHTRTLADKTHVKVIGNSLDHSR